MQQSEQTHEHSPRAARIVHSCVILSIVAMVASKLSSASAMNIPGMVITLFPFVSSTAAKPCIRADAGQAGSLWLGCAARINYTLVDLLSQQRIQSGLTSTSRTHHAQPPSGGFLLSVARFLALWLSPYISPYMAVADARTCRI